MLHPISYVALAICLLLLAGVASGVIKIKISLRKAQKEDWEDDNEDKDKPKR